MAVGFPHKYEYDIDLESDVAPARVLRMVGRGKKVLEVGAGPGSIARHLSGTLGCDVVAIEIDPTALEKLRPRARSVYAMDLNDPVWSGDLGTREGNFDVVIAADVLEHVYDPWTVLGGMKSLLNESGSVILSIPHVGHAAVAACLIDEDFEYRPWGLLDKTHIRFFGIKNIQELFTSQGLAIVQSEFVVRTPEMTEFVHRWHRLPMEVRTALERNRFATVYQVVSRAVPKERAEQRLRLMDLNVPPPEPAVAAHWKSIMASIRTNGDHSSTMSESPGSRLPTPRRLLARWVARTLGL
jgi:2-polyprenyl-3-methyl-5-hydroxy-6-metoxy-1,4-benzoquinol methylase